MAYLEDPGGVSVTSPAPVTVPADLWELRADPERLEGIARVWRDLGKAAGSAEEMVTGAAQRVIGESWSGRTADSYDGHRRRLTPEIGHVARDAGQVADALEELATVLRTNQGRLTEQAQRLSGVPSQPGTELTYLPEDPDQSTLVGEAVGAAHEIRAHVDEQLAGKLGGLETVQAELDRIGADWQPRTIGMLNLNLGQGHKNSPGNSGGTDHGDIPVIAQRIADEDVDIVALQEVAGQEMPNLKAELEARTGDQWTIHFGETGRSVYWSDGLLPRSLYTPFGNAVAVRKRGPIESSQTVANHNLNAPGGTIDTPLGPATDGSPRGAIEVDITFGGQ